MRAWSILWLIGVLSLAGCESTDYVPPKAKPSGSVASEKEGKPPVASGDSAAPSDSPSEPATIEEADGKLTLDRLVFVVPEGWQRKQAASTFILAEFTLPKAEGDDADGRLTVSVAGGSIDANLSRWRDQFGGKPEKSNEDKQQINGLEVTIVDYTGEFNDQRGPFAPPTKRSDYRMLAAVIPVEGELHFIKATGPNATIAAQAERFHEFLASVTKK